MLDLGACKFAFYIGLAIVQLLNEMALIAEIKESNLWKFLILILQIIKPYTIW